jgi:RND family efflux transporter MFP subunit
LEQVVLTTGSLAGFDRATLSTKVPGRLWEMAVDLGDAVRKGELIAQIDPRDFQLRVQQAQALLGQARVRLGLPLEGTSDEITLEEVSTVKQARALLEEAQANRGRVHALAQQKILSQSELETAEASYKVAVSRYENALQEARNQQALVAQRRAELEIALQELADTSIHAPFDGAIQERMANAGEYLNIGSPLATLVRTDPLRLRADVQERQAPQVRLGQKVRLTTEGSAKIHEGEIKRLSPGLDEQSLVLRLEADVPNPGELRPGSFARIAIVVEENVPGIVVPENAILTFAGLEKIFVVQDGTAMERLVTTGRRQNGRMEIVNGIQQGELVILSPGNIRTGDKVVYSPPDGSGNGNGNGNSPHKS